MLAAGLAICCALALSVAVRSHAGDGNDASRGQPQLARSSAAPGGLPAYEPPARRPNIVLPSNKRQGLSSQLEELYRIDLLAKSGGASLTADDVPALPASVRAAVDAGALVIDNNGRVQVFVDIIGEPAEVEPQLVALGMHVQRVSDEHHIIQGMLPISSLDAAAAIDGVAMIRPPQRGFTNQGSVLTQGDAILDANDLRAAFGVDGTGVRVGFISDGLEGLAAAQATGDLPMAGINTTTCDVIESAPPGQPANAVSPGAGFEGTALMEIVHDIAPGAELWMGYWGLNNSMSTQLDFMDAVTCLGINVDIIVDDISWFNVGLYDGTSAISVNASTNLNANLRPLRGYYVASGNQALQHYEGLWVDELPPLNNFSDFHLFQESATTTDQIEIGPNAANPIFVPAGGSVAMFLQWNDTWGNAVNDYDMYMVRNSTQEVVVDAETKQMGIGHLPIEEMFFTNDGESDYFDIYLNRYGGPNVRHLELFIPRCDCVPMAAPLPGEFGDPFLNFNVARSSLSNNADALDGVVAVGAIDAADPGNDVIEPYSSQGPTNAQAAGTPWPKPDISGVDGVSVKGSPPDFPTTFYGTSAAAPHIGGIAALVLSCKPSLQHGEPFDNPAGDKFNLRSALVNAAADLGVPGFDNVYGGGRADADASAALAGCTPATPTPTPTRTATATATVTPTPTIPAGLDTDGDGCTDVEESGEDEILGGDRDPGNAADFYDIDATGGIDLSDALAILGQFGKLPGDPAYPASFDRFVNDPAKPWRSAWAVGIHIGIDLEDVLTNLQSFGHTCFE